MLHWPFISNEPIPPKKVVANIITSVKSYNFFLENEIYISNILIKIPKYSTHFNPIILSKFTHLGEIDDENFESFKSLNMCKNMYMLITRLNICNKTFHECFYNKKINISYLNNMISCYKHLLNTVQLLNNAQLVNLDFHPRNLTTNANDDFIITNFKYFFCYRTIDEERINKLFNYNPQNIFLPLEAHVISFLLQNKYSSLSIGNVEDICNDCKNRLNSLNIFSPDFINQYKESSIKILKKYINMTTKDITSSIILMSGTWNIYSLSIVFLILLRDIFKGEQGVIKNKFVCLFSQHLVTNIHFDWNKRCSVEQNISLFDDILYSMSKVDFTDLLS
jgi:hypothetical protein